MDSSADGPDRTRDYLANERTYLAWLRTGAGVMTLGLALTHFAEPNGWSISAGLVLVAVGGVGVAYGTRRYYAVQHGISAAHPHAAVGGRGPLVASAVLGAAMLVALALLFLGD